MARIASVHFDRKSALQIYRAQPYVIEAVKLNGPPFILETPMVRQIEQGGYSQSSNSRVRYERKHIVESISIAFDLVNQWAHNGLGMTEGQRPGIWVVRDELPVINSDTGVQEVDADGKGITRKAEPHEFERMFAEDLAAYRAATIEYARWCVGDGNRIAMDARTIQFIPQEYKLAAEYLGMTVEWKKPGAGLLQMKSCPYCQSVVPSAASVCVKCTQIIDPAMFAREEERIKREASELKKKVG